MKFLNKTCPPAGRQGFTLIELLVVIAIIGILASIISVSMTSARAKGRDAKRVADLRTLQLALETYYNDNTAFPTTLGALSPNYLASIPKDPKNNTTAYQYSAYNAVPSTDCSTSKPIKYHLAAVMESDDTTSPSLKQDNDYSSGGLAVCSGTTADFNGNALACSGTSAGLTDNCYDLTN